LAPFLCLLDTKEMEDNNTKACNVEDIVSFSLEDSDTSDVDSKFESLTATPPELQQYVGAEGGDDISLGSHVSNERDSSSYDSLGDNEDISPR